MAIKIPAKEITTAFVVEVPTPFAPPRVEGKASAAEVHSFAEGIMYRLAAMLPPEYRGVYDDVAEKRPDLFAQYAVDHQ